MDDCPDIANALSTLNIKDESSHLLNNKVEEAQTIWSKVLVLRQNACYGHECKNIRRFIEDTEAFELPVRLTSCLKGAIGAKYRACNEDIITIEETTRSETILHSCITKLHSDDLLKTLIADCKVATEKIARKEIEISQSVNVFDMYLSGGTLAAVEGCIGTLFEAIERIFTSKYDKIHAQIRPPGHHCSNDQPSGFCWVNNAHIAAQYAKDHFNVKRVAIFDFDYHHGDGSQMLATQVNSIQPNSLGYFSMHDIRAWPCDSDVNKLIAASACLEACGQTIWNIPLIPYSKGNHDDFESIYSMTAGKLLEKLTKFLKEGEKLQEKSFIIISAGFDASEYETDAIQRTRVNYPPIFYEKVTRDLVKIANTYCDSKLLSILEGGYSEMALISGTMAHLLGLSLTTDSTHSQWLQKHHITAIQRASINKKQTTKVSKAHPSIIESEEDLRWVEKLQKHYQDDVLTQNMKSLSFANLSESVSRRSARIKQAASVPSTPVSHKTEVKLSTVRIVIKNREALEEKEEKKIPVDDSLTVPKEKSRDIPQNISPIKLENVLSNSPTTRSAELDTIAILKDRFMEKPYPQLNMNHLLEKNLTGSSLKFDTSSSHPSNNDSKEPPSPTKASKEHESLMKSKEGRPETT